LFWGQPESRKVCRMSLSWSAVRIGVSAGRLTGDALRLQRALATSSCGGEREALGGVFSMVVKVMGDVMLGKEEIVKRGS
jgi:hypothetical protein